MRQREKRGGEGLNQKSGNRENSEVKCSEELGPLPRFPNPSYHQHKNVSTEGKTIEDVMKDMTRKEKT